MDDERDGHTITWLHLSDHHAGQRGSAARASLERAFERSVRETLEHLGPPDLLLFTGDLAFKGAIDEYKAVDHLLERINNWVGCELPVFAVPGNHDLARPKDEKALSYEFLTTYETSERLRRCFERSQPLAQLQTLFANYSAWAQRRVFEPARAAGQLSHQSTLVPGDFSAVFTKSGLRVGLVGLNSSWVQYDGGEFEGKLQLPVEQFHAALPPVDEGTQVLSWFDELDAALLLMHHPPSWLSKRARASYERDIYTPETFALALYGHMHQARSEVISASGTHPRAYYQAPSLFGLERYGADDENRSFGYSWGRVWASGELRVWPKVAFEQGGRDAFVDDPGFERMRDKLGGVQLRAARVPPSVTPTGAAPARYDSFQIAMVLGEAEAVYEMLTWLRDEAKVIRTETTDRFGWPVNTVEGADQIAVRLQQIIAEASNLRDEFVMMLNTVSIDKSVFSNIESIQGARFGTSPLIGRFAAGVSITLDSLATEMLNIIHALDRGKR